MAYPPAYTRDYSFTDFETTNPGDPKPGPALDTEFDDVSNALTATQTALALIQRADGALANGIVGEDQLDPTLFADLGDAATADAEAAAAAAQGYANAAAGSASAAAASAADAATSAGIASGAAAQAGVSQSIAQDAANEAALSAADADTSADVAVAAANDTAGSVAATEAAVQRAFEWAELLTGPVLPAPPGWPEAVDDGMFSSKWWAIRAREYNSTETIDLGTAGADIGEAFDIWDAIPGNDLGPGLTYATWGSPPQTYVLTDRSDPSDPASWTNITGGPGPAGPGNTLTIGTVTTGAVGQPADATITGASPNQVLNLTLPTGATGPQGVIGPAGPPNALAVGTVTTGAPGSSAVVGITGTSPSQTIDFTIPRGDTGATGAQGIQGIQGPVGPAVNLADPTGVIGLVAVNGAATTAPRSDSSPALSQAIAPTWTAQHIFALNGALGPNGSSVKIAANPPYFEMQNTAAPANQGRWVNNLTSTNWQLFATDDAGAIANLVVRAVRAVANITDIQFGNTTNNPTYNFLGTGLTTMGGPLQVNGDHIGLSNTDVYFQMIDTDAAADAKIWWLRNSGGPFAIQTRADSLSAGMNALLFTRVGTAVTQMLVGPDGTAALPAISFFNDNDTGLYRNSPDALAFAIAGARAGVIFGGGFQLDIGAFYAPSGIPTQPSYSFSADGDSGMFLAATGVVSLAAGGVSYFSILDGSGMPVRVNTGQLGVPDGTAAAPAYSFTNDPDTGFYRVGGDTIGLVTGGLVRFVFGPQGIQGAQNDARIILADGTAAAPAYTFSNDLDTGFFRPGADRISVACAGITIIDIDRGGTNRVTINIPTGFSDGTAAVPSITFSQDNDTGFFRSASDLMAASSGGIKLVEWLGPLASGVPRTRFTAVVSNVDGTTAFPAISFEADLDTGIFRPFNDGLAIAAGGAAGAYILSSGLYAGPAGSASAPSISFINDSDTGFYNVSANYFAAMAGGILCCGFFNASANGQALFATGASGTPPISFDGDRNTGFYSQASDVIGCTAGGVLVASIHGTGITAVSFTTSSSRAIKRETGKPSRAADILSRLRPVLYRLLAGDPREQLGLIAEEVHELCPQLSDGKSVSYDRLALLLLADWQESRGIAA